MPIEADKRGPGHAIALTYEASGERFNVPDNVYLLGLMNTADRSLAIVDYALRRRFAFETLKPAYGTRQFREYLLEAGVDRVLVDRIDGNMSRLNESIRDDKDLGPGFQIEPLLRVLVRPSNRWVDGSRSCGSERQEYPHFQHLLPHSAMPGAISTSAMWCGWTNSTG